jgi:hypothetical protein
MQPQVTDAVLGGTTHPAVKLGTMPLELASKIVDQCTSEALGRLGFEDYKDAKLPEGVSLEELLIANRVVSEANNYVAEQAKISKGSYKIQSTVADRGIAAAYALENFGGVYGLIEALGFSVGEDEE